MRPIRREAEAFDETAEVWSSQTTRNFDITDILPDSSFLPKHRRTDGEDGAWTWSVGGRDNQESPSGQIDMPDMGVFSPDVGTTTMSQELVAKTILGTTGNDWLFGTKGKADALFNFDLPYNYVWDRVVSGLSGNYMILRGRPGDYKADGVVGNRLGDGPYQTWEMTGNVFVNGGEGWDKVSYFSYDGGIEIELEPVPHDVGAEPSYWNDLHGGAYMSSTAKAYGETPNEIFGFDYLKSIEHATGTNQADFIKGSELGNKLYGLDGNDKIEGRGGHDTLKGGEGHDTMHGGEGDDALEGGDGNDRMYGDAGDDGMLGGDGNDKIYGDDGEDTISAGDGNDKVWGGDDDDVMFGGDGDDFLNTGTFFDGIDEANGGNGDDKIVVGRMDSANGGSGNDTVVVDPNSGFPEKAVFVSLNWLGDGTFGQLAADGSFLDTGTLDSIENVVTGHGNDQVWISDIGANVVKTTGGNDFVSTAGGNDTIETGLGHDQAYGGSGDDEIDAGSGNDYVDGESGDDEINGGSGDDDIVGGVGEDTMTGGTGSDGFIWKEDHSGVDTITDFQVGEDYLVIQDFLADPVPMGDSYVGKVFAFITAEGNALLSALTDDGWEAFVELEGISVHTAWDAIQSGELFSSGTLFEEFDGGPGGWAPQPSPFDDSSPFGPIDGAWSTDSFIF